MMSREEIRREWIRRLRSGEILQGNGVLCQDGRYCCLGVLSEIACEIGMAGSITDHEKTKIFIANDGEKQYTYLMDSVVNLVGLLDNMGSQIGDRINCLSRLNDNGYTFTEIADLLETGTFWEENQENDHSK